MILIDQHVHSKMSHDGKSSFIEHMTQGRIIRLEEITFTDHLDIYDGVNTSIKELDVEKNRNEYYKYKDDSLLKTNFGIEVGLRPECYDKIIELLHKVIYDFVIGSLHITCGKDMAYDKTFFEGLTPHEAAVKYFNEVLKCVQMYKDEFDVLGHMDYIIRYIMKYYPGEMDRIVYKEYQEVLDEILKTLIANNRGIEINTSGIRYNVGSCHPTLETIKRYKELGGKYITVGSDAHVYKDLASNFNIANDMLEAAGFDSITVYHSREPRLVKINK